MRDNKAIAGAVLWLKTLSNLTVLLSVILFIALAALALDHMDKRRRLQLTTQLGPEFTQSSAFRGLFPDVTLKYVLLILILFVQVFLVTPTNFLPLVLINVITATVAAVAVMRPGMRMGLLNVCWKMHLSVILGKVIELSWPFPEEAHEQLILGITFASACVYFVLDTVDSKDADHQAAYFTCRPTSAGWTYILSEREEEEANAHSRGKPTRRNAQQTLGRTNSEEDLFVTSNYDKLVNDARELELQQRRKANREAYERAKAEEEQSKEEVQARKELHQEEGFFDSIWKQE